jgi:hypothetical protein
VRHPFLDVGSPSNGVTTVIVGNEEEKYAQEPSQQESPFESLRNFPGGFQARLRGKHSLP